MGLWNRDPVIGDETRKVASRFEISGKWPNIKILLDDREVENVMSVSLSVESNSIPTLSLDIAVGEVDIQVDPAAIEGWGHLQGEDGEMLHLGKITLPKESYDAP